MKWCLDNGISSQVTTPVTAADLAAALISALESNTGGPVSAQKNVLFDILLAEDNLVNQKLAVKILERYGHTVEIAENGSLALEAFKQRVLQNQPFDIILVRSHFSTSMYISPLIRVLDGCVYAFYGRYGGDRVNTRLRGGERADTNTNYCSDRSCQCVLDVFITSPLTWLIVFFQ